MLWRIDDFLVEKTEKFCHKIQMLTGRTNYFLISLTHVFLAGTILLIVWRWMPHGLQEIPDRYLISKLVVTHPVVAGFMVFLSLVGAFWSWAYWEKKAYDRVCRGLANPKKAELLDRSFRLLVVFATPFFVPLFGWSLDVAAYLLMLVQNYLEACDPLPPCGGKLWERIRAFWAKPCHQTGR